MDKEGVDVWVRVEQLQVGVQQGWRSVIRHVSVGQGRRPVCRRAGGRAGRRAGGAAAKPKPQGRLQGCLAPWMPTGMLWLCRQAGGREATRGRERSGGARTRKAHSSEPSLCLLHCRSSLVSNALTRCSWQARLRSLLRRVLSW